MTMQAHKGGRETALIHSQPSTRKTWMVTTILWLLYPLGYNLVPIAQEAWWSLVLVWITHKVPSHQDMTPDCPACSKLLY
jgi:hypothetical protein